MAGSFVRELAYLGGSRAGAESIGYLARTPSCPGIGQKPEVGIRDKRVYRMDATHPCR